MQLSIEEKRYIYHNLIEACTELKRSYNETESDYETNEDVALYGIDGSLAVIKDNLNKLLTAFDINSTCFDVILTHNTDNVVFGIKVSPTIIDQDALKIIMDEAIESFTRFALEIDDKLLDILMDIEPIELAGYIIEEVVSTVSIQAIEDCKNIIALTLTAEDKVIEIKQSVNYTQLLTFAIKNIIYNNSSLIYKPEDKVGYNEVAESLELKELLLVTQEKVKSSVTERLGDETAPNMGVLKWVLMIYEDPISFYRRAEETLTNAKQFTGSSLDKQEIDRTLICLQRSALEVVAESTNLNEAFKGFSLFKNLKQNGLRAIEDDLYEFKIRLKNCEVEDEALYIVRQINTRISILEDYIRNTDISESEYDRWSAVIEQYKELRAEVAKKKIGNKKQYGVFVDYDKLDQLDNYY